MHGDRTTPRREADTSRGYDIIFIPYIFETVILYGVFEIAPDVLWVDSLTFIGCLNAHDT